MEHVIVCGDHPYVAGSKLVFCAKCGRGVYCSPSGQDLVAENPETITICRTCVVVTDDTVIIPPTPQARKELYERGHSDEDIDAAIWLLESEGRRKRVG